MRSLRPPWLFAVTVALCGCGGSSLDGSLRQVVDLAFDDVELRRTTDEVAVAFVRTSGDTALQVTATVTGLELKPGVVINLAEKLSATQQRGILSRNVRNDATTRFPALERGSLQLDGELQTATRVSGSFNATFVQGPTEPMGRTVSGTFEALVR